MTRVRDTTPADYDPYVERARELRVDDPVPSRERFAADLRPRMMIAEDDALAAEVKRLGAYVVRELLHLRGGL